MLFFFKFTNSLDNNVAKSCEISPKGVTYLSITDSTKK